MLVNYVAYQDGGKVADIPKEEIGKYVKHPDFRTAIRYASR